MLSIMNELIEKFIETNSSIHEWDKKELNQLSKFVREEIKGKGAEHWGETGINFFSGSHVSYDFVLKFEKTNFSVDHSEVVEIYQPQSNITEGTLVKGDRVGAIECLTRNLQYGHEEIYSLLSNTIPKSKIRLIYDRFKNKKSTRYECSLETENFDARIIMIKNKFKSQFNDDKIVISKLKEWKRSLFKK